MHGKSGVHPVLPSTDLVSIREFYPNELGHDVVVENEHAIHATVNLGGFSLTSEVSDGQDGNDNPIWPHCDLIWPHPRTLSQSAFSF